LLALAVLLVVQPCVAQEENPGHAAEGVPTAQDVRELMDKTPMTEATWPAWRDYYVRLYFAYDVDEPQEFYERMREFVGATAVQKQGDLPEEWKDDPVAYVVLTYYFMGKSEIDRAVESGRRAVALDRDSPMASFILAVTLIWQTRTDFKWGTPLTAEQDRRIAEAETLLTHVEQEVPQARLIHWRGEIALFRDQRAAALPLLLQGTRDYPKRSNFAIEYLSVALGSAETPKPFAATSSPFVDAFPNDAHILALHAQALFQDERGPEAFQAFEQARRQNPRIDDYVGKQWVEVLEQGKWMTPLVFEGMKLLGQKSFVAAAAKFRTALEGDPENARIARLLASAVVAEINSRQALASPAEIRQALHECESLSERFPAEPELHVVRAAMLFRSGRSEDANEALDRARSLGGDVDKLAGPQGALAVREAARSEKQKRLATQALCGGLILYAGWIGLMFGIGFVLSGRRPPEFDAAAHSEGHASEDTGLKWAYLFVLSLGLVMFYLSVPFVSLGLLAVTAGLFFLLLVVRVLHLGVLYRGLYATWGVISSAVVGTNRDVFGIKIEEDQHPRLFAALREVAQDLNTRPADEVYLTPQSAIGVSEQGKGPFGLWRRRRVMEIGMPTFSCLTVPEFKSVIAHEFAHFSHQDPFYGRFIFQVSIALQRSLAMMNAAGGVLTWINPFYWFYWLYLKAYLLLAAGFSRSCEYLADRRAVLAYGKQAFISGLTKISVNDVLFGQTAVFNIHERLQHGQAFVNVFSTFRDFREQPQAAEMHDKILESVVAAKGGRMDSHPTYSERIAAAERFEERRESADRRRAMELLTEAEKLEEQLTWMLTRVINDNIAMTAAATAAS
jgi:Zn-dependent protease with chaperone function